VIDYIDFTHKAKAKARDSYIARLTAKPDQPRFTIIGSAYCITAWMTFTIQKY